MDLSLTDCPVFDFFSPQRLIFGPGQIARLPELAAALGAAPILVTGRSSLKKTDLWDQLEKAFAQNGMDLDPVTISGEPSVEDIDRAVSRFRQKGADLVVAIGGGSVLDAGKAISAMIPETGSVEEFLEGEGCRPHTGKKLPFIAVPTTSGTGSEATKNAVISRPGPSGFKKSLRHPNFIPDLALVDPGLTLTCPPGVTAACGMDALTQLMEAYVSIQASPMTDALCAAGLKGFGRALETAVKKDPLNLDARTRLSFGAYLSGLALANAGLGIVHGFASVIGGISFISHGNVCGSLLAETTKAIIEALHAKNPAHPALEKYAATARLLGISSTDTPLSQACSRLLDALFDWTEKFNMPPLSGAGITRDQIPAIAGAVGQKNTPVLLSQDDLSRILGARL